MQGTALYNLIWNRDTRASDGLAKGEARFAGRVAVNLTPVILVGVGVGSWALEVPVDFAGTDLERVDAIASAVAGTLYGQVYPLRQVLFVRAGIGFAKTRTYTSDGFSDATFAVSHDTHAGITGGIGIDIGLRRHLALSISLDYIQLLGVTGARELKSAETVGVGITVR